MDQICIVGLIGLPAVGKTTFSKLFLEIETLPFNILHICYDHFLNSTEAAVPYKVQRECLLTNVASTVESLKKSKIFCNNLNLQSCSRYKDYGHDRVMIICDDNNYYSSMRFKLYQIARKFSISYGQIYFECNAELALRRNSLRFANKVPEEVFHKMSLDLEIPQLAQHYWEINTLNMHTDNINRQFILSDIVPFLTQLFDCPVKPLESEMTKCLTKQSRVHDLDLLMRKRIGLLMNSKVYLNKNEMAKLLNDKRKDILKKFQDMEIHEETDIDGVFRLFEKNLESIYNTQVSDV